MDNLRDHRMETVDAMQDLIVDALGPAGALDAICRALDYDTKADIYGYIIRVYDLIPDDADAADDDNPDTDSDSDSDSDTAGTGRKEE